MLTRSTLAAIIVLAGTAATCAQDQVDRRQLRAQFRSSCEFWGTCYMQRYDRWRQKQAELRQSWREHRDRDRWTWTFDPRYERNSVHRAQKDWEQRISTPAYKLFGQCHTRIIEVLSGQHKSEEVAMRDAWTMWVANIQFERGALYQEPNNSVQRWSVCAPTDIGDTVTGVVSRFGGKVYGAVRAAATGKQDTRDDGRNIRCRLWARACPEIAEPAETIEETKQGRIQDRRDQRRR
jgi:hypothetical protein